MDDATCWVSILGNPEGLDDKVFLGLPFLENYYTVFDVTNQKLGISKSISGYL